MARVWRLGSSGWSRILWRRGLRGGSPRWGSCGFKINTLISLRVMFICTALKGIGPKMQKEIIGVWSGVRGRLPKPYKSHPLVPLAMERRTDMVW